MDLQSLGPQVLDITKQVGKFITDQRKIFSIDKAELKGVQDFVSYVDKEAEKHLVEHLGKAFPEAGFIAEEQTASHSNEEYIWVIDPLDGTTNFIHGVAPFAISVALKTSEKVVLGVVYELVQQEMFYSWEGIDVFCNEEKIAVRDVAAMNQGLISTGFHINDFSRLPNHLKAVEYVVRNSHGLRRHGSAATDLAYVAAGRFDGFFEYGLSPWDVSAGSYLVTKAGGAVSDYKGGNNFYFGREICAGAKGVHAELVKLLSEVMF